MIYLIDVGHRNNANDFGAFGNGYRESELALSISKKLKSELEKRGATVYLSRNSENETIGINERPAKAKQLKADYLISIHLNAFSDTKANGVEVLYKSQKAKAEKVSNKLAEVTGFRNRGAKQRTDLGVLNGFENSILVECGFLTNLEEVKKLADGAFQTKIAEAIADCFENKKINTKIDGKGYYFKQVINDGVTYTEVRSLLETLGHKVTWDNSNKVLEIQKGD